MADKLTEEGSHTKSSKQHISKLEDNDNQANLTNLTIRSSQFQMSARKEDEQEESKFPDIESGVGSAIGLDASIRKKKSDEGGH